MKKEKFTLFRVIKRNLDFYAKWQNGKIKVEGAEFEEEVSYENVKNYLAKHFKITSLNNVRKINFKNSPALHSKVSKIFSKADLGAEEVEEEYNEVEEMKKRHEEIGEEEIESRDVIPEMPNENVLRDYDNLYKDISADCLSFCETRDIDVQEQVIYLNHQDFTKEQLEKIKSEIENAIKFYNIESIVKVEIRDYKDIYSLKEFNQFIKEKILLWNGAEFISIYNENLSVVEVENMFNVRLNFLK